MNLRKVKDSSSSNLVWMLDRIANRARIYTVDSGWMFLPQSYTRNCSSLR
jgi:hypothetical protein